MVKNTRGGGGAPAINNDTIGREDSERREEAQPTYATQLITARLDQSRRDEDNEQQHTRQEEQGVIENEQYNARHKESTQTIPCR